MKAAEAEGSPGSPASAGDAGGSRDAHAAAFSDFPAPLGPLGKGETLSLERLDDGTFTGYCHGGRAAHRAYGGAVVAQALAAACRTVDEDRPVHSLHAYFLRALDSRRPVRFASRVLRDGRSYSARQVEATQEGHHALTMTVSFKERQPTANWRHPEMPDLPGPDGLEDGFAHRPATHPLRQAVEFREIPPVLDPGQPEIERFGWFRTVGALPDGPAAHAGAVAYLCDATLAPTALVPHEPTSFERGRPSRHTIASLDHAMWFHRPFRADRWLLYAQRSRVEGDGRTLAYGEFWSPEGELAVSVIQEALLHVREP
ncbi:acyl-CoA thioesterase II [Streptomyces antnestii]|uniref:Acyl-CoA thioesterase II n=1 Tax=Streptomyces antnestii TaxID=2494256 RepID=A0A3S2VKC3_9ACTN|nr:acyl-CoA thioesterase domain-containing protein [Streptomyces sp. San01]RVU27954.1 acyl-CoA thioesterase II [Streptomyces sp. San01]